MDSSDIVYKFRLMYIVANIYDNRSVVANRNFVNFTVMHKRIFIYTSNDYVSVTDNPFIPN